MNDPIGRSLLEAAAVAVQKLEKKLRQLRNRDDATDQDVADAKAAIAACRQIAARHGLKVSDWDGRAK